MTGSSGFVNGEQVLLSIREHLVRHDGDIVKLFDLERERVARSEGCRSQIGERIFNMERETRDALHSLQQQIAGISLKVTAIIAGVMLLFQYAIPALIDTFKG